MLLICVSCLRAGKEAQEAYNHPTCEVKRMFSPWLALSRHAWETNTCLLSTVQKTLWWVSCVLIMAGFYQRALLRDKGEVWRLWMRNVLTGRRMTVCDSVACDVLVVLLSVCCCCRRWKYFRTGIVFPDIWPETEWKRDWWGVQHAKFGTR